jgi:ABC-type dipeptide/oligopeptide/nickel transport system ATPase component
MSPTKMLQAEAPPATNGKSPPAAVLPDFLRDEATFAAGVRDLVDLVAPTNVVVDKNYLYVEQEGNGRYMRYFSVVGFPRRVNAGWVERLTSLRLPLQIVFHIAPFESDVIIRHLELQLTKIQSSRAAAARSNRLEKADQMIGAEDLRRIMNEVAAGLVRIFSVSLTICVHASSRERLDQRASLLLSHLRQQQLRTQGCSYLQDSAWQTTQPHGLDTLYRRTNQDSASLSMGLPFTTTAVGTGDGPYIGKSDNDEAVHFTPWSLLTQLANANIAVVGESGQGKSYLIKILLTGLLGTGMADGVVLDKDDDYLKLVNYLGPAESQWFNLARGCPINPLDVPFSPRDARTAEPGTDLLSEFVNNDLMAFYTLLLAPPGSLLSREYEAFLYQLTLACLAEQGLTKEEIWRSPEALERPSPTFADLLKTAQGQRAPTREMRFGLIEQLEKVSYLFRGETSVTVNRPLTVFSIHDLDEAYYPLMIWAARNFVARHRARKRDQRFLVYVIEEASFIMKHPAGRVYLEQSSRAFRKLGVSQVTISQHPDDFLEDGKVIIANAGTAFFLGMKQSAIEKLKLAPNLARILEHARRGDALMRLGNEYAHIHVEASQEENAIFTTDPIEIMRLREAQAAAQKAPTLS